MATHSHILAWKTPWTEEPSGLQSTHGASARHAYHVQVSNKNCTIDFTVGDNV